MGKFRGIIAVLVLVTLGVIVAQAGSASSNDSQQQGTTQGQNAPPNENNAPKSVSPPASQTNAGEGDKEVEQSGKQIEQFADSALAGMLRFVEFVDAHEGFFLVVFTALLAVFTYMLRSSTDKLWKAGDDQMVLIKANAAQQSIDMQASIKVAEDAAKAANRSAEVAERTMVLNDRPWVGVELQILRPLVFTADGCSIKLDVTITNHGRSPAIRTEAYVEFFVSTIRAIEWRNKMEDSARYMVANMFGQTLFPAVPRPKKWSLTASRDDISAGMAEDEENRLRPIVAYCVYYSLPTGGRARYTSGIREIFRIGHEPFDGKPATFTDREIRFLDMVTEDAT